VGPRSPSSGGAFGPTADRAAWRFHRTPDACVRRGRGGSGCGAASGLV